jgi:pre-mRNA-splicing factor CWC26
MLRTRSVDSFRFAVSSSSALSVATLASRLLDNDLWAARLLADAADDNDDDALVVSLMGGWKKCRFLAEDDGGRLVPDMVQAQPHNNNLCPPPLPTMSTTASMKAYLARKYMCGPKADAILAREQTKKKKKRKHADSGQHSHSGGGMGVVDDDGGWGAAVSEDEDGDLAEAVVASDRTFKKRKVADGDSGGWIPAVPPEKPPTPPPEEDEQPVIVEDESAPRGGLLSQAELQKRFGTQTRKLKEDLPTAEQQETVYRDTSGRKIDTKAERAEAARQKREQEEMDARRMQWGKGLVQREETEEARKQMEHDRLKGFAR